MTDAQTPNYYGTNTSHDLEIWKRTETVVSDSGRTLTDVLESFPLYVRRINLTRFLAHYELYRMVKDLPGSIVECGVYRGSSLLSFAKFLEIFHPGDRSRKVYGFDSFSGFTTISVKDGADDSLPDVAVGAWNPAAFYEELKRHVEIFREDSFIPRHDRITLIEGDLCKTAQEFVESNPGLRISLLHLDCDVYEPTLAALKAFYPLMVNGGLVISDQYALTSWPGESAAIEEYFKEKMPLIQKFPFTSLPGGYFFKN